MVGRTNSVSGSGTPSDGRVSVIWVSYPQGYTCMCSGKETYTAGDKSGQWRFEVAKPGDYVISLVEDETGEYPPITVAVTKLGTLRAIRLKRWGEYHPIQNGEISSMYTFGFMKNVSSCSYEITDTGPKIHAPAASSSWCQGYFEEPIYLSPEWTKMVVTITGRGYMLTAGLMKDLSLAYTSISGNMVVFANGGQATTRTEAQYEIDISELTDVIVPEDSTSGEYYFAFRTAGSGSSNYQGNMTINDLYFE